MPEQLDPKAVISSLPLPPIIQAIMLALIDQLPAIVAQSSGEIKIDYGVYQAKIRVVPAPKTYKVSQQPPPQ